MLKLPDVTLVCVETREHVLAAMAVDECLRKAEFDAVLVLTDKPELFSEVLNYRLPLDPGGPNAPIQCVVVPDWPDKVGWSRSWWYDVPPLLRTRQTLNIQWDSWIADPSMWDDEWMKYDYVGAPWWYEDGKNVGNGGFSLVSTRLKRFLAKNRDRFPCDSSIDDDLLCRQYRVDLEGEGFIWAPEPVAWKFSYEGCNSRIPFTKHFGFHAMFNWGHVLDHERLRERVLLAMDSPGIANGYQMKAFCEANPEFIKQLAAEGNLGDELRATTLAS